MAKVTLNPVLEGLRGKVGDLVFRRHGDGTILSRKPIVKGEPTQGQATQRARFADAVMYGRLVMADPEAKAFYDQAAKGKGIPVFSLTVADFFNAPSVNEVDLSQYQGAAGDPITVLAYDDVDVVSVAVAITQEDGTPVEQGAAAEIGPGRWAYTTTTPVSAGTTVRISVTAEDRPGRTTQAQQQKAL